jgi:hypothetical protein
MKTLIMALVLFLQGNQHPNTQPLVPAETVAWNTSSTGFTVTITRIADNQTSTFSMPPGFYNIDNKWQLVAGLHNVTFTPTGGSSYGPTTFSANGESTTRYNSVNTGPVTLSNIQLYEGGGNQVNIQPAW